MTGSSDAAIKHLDALLSTSRLLVAVGSGGVGKTTTAAALAIAAARRGRRCAVLTIDPARRLAQALGLDELGNTPRPLAADLVAPGACDAMMLHAPEAFDELIARLVPDENRRQRLYDNRLYQVIARHLGGTHEYMAVERLYALMEDKRYDLVVLDTPPTVNALDFLDAPTRIAAFFSDKITRFFIRQREDAADGPRKGIMDRIKDRAGDIAMSLLGKALGEGFVDELSDFAIAFQGLFVAFQERGLVAEKILRDPKTSFLVVSGADPMRVAEAAEFARTLADLGIAPRAFIANRVHTSHAEAEVRLDAAAVQDALAGFQDGAGDANQLAQDLEKARRIRASLAQRDRSGLARLGDIGGMDRLLVVPELDEEVEDRGAIEHLLQALQAPAPP